jgi:hypothetical protein
MKDGMAGHISAVQSSMFNKSCDTVMENLREMIEKTELKMRKQTKESLSSLRRDYQAAVGISDHSESKAIQGARRCVARKLLIVLGAIDQLGLEPAS